MGKRLSAKHQKRIRDQLTAYKNGTSPKKCKVAVSRSKKALFKKSNRMN